MTTQLLIEPTDKIDWIDEVNARGITGYTVKEHYTSNLLVSVLCQRTFKSRKILYLFSHHS